MTMGMAGTPQGYSAAQAAQYQAMQAHQQAQMQQQQQMQPQQQQQQQHLSHQIQPVQPQQLQQHYSAPKVPAQVLGAPRTKSSIPLAANSGNTTVTHAQASSSAALTSASAMTVPPLIDDEVSARADILDHLTARQLAIQRFAKHHDAMSTIMDPWQIDSILSGKKRKREMDDALKLGRNPLQGGFAGAAHDGQLSALACTAVRAQLVGMEPGPLANLLASVVDPSRSERKLSLEERREALLAMKESAEKDVEAMELRHRKRVERTQAGSVQSQRTTS